MFSPSQVWNTCLRGTLLKCRRQFGHWKRRPHLFCKQVELLTNVELLVLSLWEWFEQKHTITILFQLQVLTEEKAEIIATNYTSGGSARVLYNFYWAWKKSCYSSVKLR